MKRLITLFLLSLLLLFTIAIANSCGGGGSGGGGGGDSGSTPPSGGGGGSEVSAVIGPAGGSLTASDGRLSLQVPAGALNADTTITLGLISNDAPQGTGTAYRFSPDNLTFNTPATLTLKYSDADIEGGNEEILGIAFKDAQGVWQGYTSGTRDTTAKTLSVQTTHLSDWAAYEAYIIFPKKTTILTDSSTTFNVYKVGPATGHSNSGDETIPLVPLGVPLLPNDWLVNGISGGNTVVGQIQLQNGEGRYTAPSKMPTANPVAVSAQLTLEDLSNVILVSNTRVIARDWGLKIRYREAWICGGGNIASYTHDSPAYIIFHLGDDFQISGYDTPSPLPQSLTNDGVCPEYASVFSATVTTGERTKINSISGGYQLSTEKMQLTVSWKEPDFPRVLVIYQATGTTALDRPLTPGSEATNPVIISPVYGAEIGPFGGGNSLQYLEIYWNLYEPS